MPNVNVPAPTPIALVLCDNVYRDSKGKMALVGLFTNIKSRVLPAIHPRMCVFASITSTRPGTRLRLEIVNGETEQTVVQAEGGVPDSIQPTNVFELVFELGNVRFEETGLYFIRLLGNGETLVQRPFEVIKIEPRNQQNENEEEQ